jgi:hypothetical protein
MAAERQIPGGPFVNETGTAQRQIPGGSFVNETAGTAPATYTLTSATYVPSSLTSTSVTPRIVRTKA